MRDMIAGERVAQAACALVGAPFRLRGRSPATGLDCVGLCLCALRGAGHDVREPPSYTLRGGTLQQVSMVMAATGLSATDAGAEGDILLVRTGPMQLHLMIASADGLVHAHAGLGQVVHMPGASPWPILGRWALRPLPSLQDKD